MSVQQKGLIQLLPLLIIAAIVVLALYILFFSSNRIFSLLGVTEPTRAQAVLDTEPPSAPTNLKVYGSLPVTKDGNSKDNLTWSPSTDNVGVATYLIYQIVSGIYDPKSLAEVTTTSYTRIITSSGYPTDYSYYIVAKDGSGNLSLKSNIAHMMGVWGDVLDTNYRYIRGAKIEAIGTNASKASTIANNTGAYLINLTPGDYTVNFTANGYVSQTWPMTVVDNQMTTRNVFMRKGK